MLKRILAVFLSGLLLISVSACSDENEKRAEKAPEKQEETQKPKVDKKADNEKPEDEAELPKEEEVEVIYAKTPEEAADKCMASLYTGDFTDAKQYVSPTGNAFKEITAFREKIMRSAGYGNANISNEKSQRLIKNIFKNISYTRQTAKADSKRATINYTVLIPETSGIDYSVYMDKYIASLGLSMEQFMMQTEGMSKEEAEKWASEFGIDILNYVFETAGNVNKTTKNSVLTVENSKNGWIVTDIKNLAN